MAADVGPDVRGGGGGLCAGRIRAEKICRQGNASSFSNEGPAEGETGVPMSRVPRRDEVGDSHQMSWLAVSPNWEWREARERGE